MKHFKVLILLASTCWAQGSLSIETERRELVEQADTGEFDGDLCTKLSQHMLATGRLPWDANQWARALNQADRCYDVIAEQRQ